MVSEIDDGQREITIDSILWEAIFQLELNVSTE